MLQRLAATTLDIKQVRSACLDLGAWRRPKESDLPRTGSSDEPAHGLDYERS
jgi:hypothetical protein